MDRLDGRPDPAAAVRAVARRHGRDEAEVLLTAGASEAFVLLARVLSPQHPVAVDAWHEVFPAGPVEDADLVLVGSPSPRTGRVPDELAALHRPGRTVVVDEAWGDAADGSLAGQPGLVVVRSLSRTWGIAGLRVGYLLAEPGLVAELRRAQQPWPMSAPALTALETCLARGPVRAAERATEEGRARLTAGLQSLGLEVLPGSQGPYLLCTGVPDLREGLPPGVHPVDRWCWRVDVPAELDLLVQQLQDVLVQDGRPPRADG